MRRSLQGCRSPIFLATLAALVGSCAAPTSAAAATTNAGDSAKFSSFVTSLVSHTLRWGVGSGTGIGVDALRQMLTALTIGAGGVTRAELERIVGPPIDIASRPTSQGTSWGLTMLFRNAAPVPAVLARLRRFLGVSEVGGWPSEKLERRMGNGQRCEPPLAARVLPGIFVVVACASTRAAWRVPFNVASTTAGTFHGSRDDVSVDFMRSTRSLDVASLGPCRAARLPLVGTFDAVFILPRASGEAALRACIGRIPELLATPYRQKLVDLWLPKRHLEFHTELNDAFREMGLRTLGDVKRGDFSPLLGGTRQLYKSYFATLNLRLDERGVVASSQTVAVFRELRVTLGRPLLFHLNRPFIFCLSDRGSHSLQLVAAITQP